MLQFKRDNISAELKFEAIEPIGSGSSKQTLLRGCKVRGETGAKNEEDCAKQCHYNATHCHQPFAAGSVT